MQNSMLTFIGVSLKKGLSRIANGAPKRYYSTD
jgi:hypothetical protein